MGPLKVIGLRWGPSLKSPLEVKSIEKAAKTELSSKRSNL